MKKTKKYVIIFISIFVILQMPACNNGGNTSSQGNISSQSSDGLPQIELDNKSLNIMGYEPLKSVVDFAKEKYGIEVTTNVVDWFSYPQKLAGAVLSNAAPDLVMMRQDFNEFPNYIVSDLVQPIDDFVDIDSELYKDFESGYKMTIWGGKHYLAITGQNTWNEIYYNKKLFEDAGVEDPWDLYDAGKWDWNTFKTTAKDLTGDSSSGGLYVYGFGLNPPYGLVYTVGKPYGELDYTNKSVKNNISDPDIARAIGFLQDMIYKDQIGIAKYENVLSMFQSGQIAMLLGAGSYQLPEVQEIAKQGNLGIAPLPKDPNADKYYSRGFLAGYFIAKGAKNPKAAGAFIACFQGRKNLKVDKTEREKAFAETYFLAAEQLQQYDKIRELQTPVFDLCTWIGAASVWLSLSNNKPWATQIAEHKSKIDAQIYDLFAPVEYDAPSGPKVVENFEKIGSNTTDQIYKYAKSTGGAGAEIYLDNKNPGEGKYCGRIICNSTDIDWGGVTKTVNKTWNGNNTLSFLLKSDGKGKINIGIGFVTLDGMTWQYIVEDFTATEWTKFEIPFTDFKATFDGYEIDLTKIQSSFVNYGGIPLNSKREFYVDDIQAIAK